MHFISLPFVALLALAMPAMAQSEPSKDWSHHTGKVPFVVGYEAGMAKARAEHKPVMLFITTTWCGWCKKLAGESFTDDAVAAQLEAFIPVIVDGDVEQGITQKFGVDGYPDIRFLTADGKDIGHVGGYVPKAAFLKSVESARQALTTVSPPTRVVFDSAAAAQGLAVGDTVPALTLKTSAGEAFDLRASVQAKPTVLIFYRGGWCPFCNKHLSALQQIQGDLQTLGYQVLAISPDAPESAAETAATDKLGYALLSDTGNAAAREFKLAFKLDGQTIEKYGSMGIDLKAQDWTLPVPAAFVIGTDAKVAYAHVNPDYKQRIDNAALLDAARKVLAESHVSTSR